MVIPDLGRLVGHEQGAWTYMTTGETARPIVFRALKAHPKPMSETTEPTPDEPNSASAVIAFPAGKASKANQRRFEGSCPTEWCKSIGRVMAPQGA